MPFKNFKIESNQTLWEKYYAHQLATGKAKSSIPQYKPVLLHLEQLTGKSFNEVMVSDIVELSAIRKGNNMAHLKSFYVTALNQSWMKCSEDMIIYLLPTEYKGIVQGLLAG